MSADFENLYCPSSCKGHLELGSALPCTEIIIVTNFISDRDQVPLQRNYKFRIELSNIQFKKYIYKRTKIKYF